MRDKQHDQPIVIVVQRRHDPDEPYYWIARAHVGDQLPEAARSSSARGAVDKLVERLGWL